ncbi:class I SAM-dependent methyltransferase [Altibacter sp.]|uniref:class I SAM-dependent methyltransferase n=1 Tax=Altibacter sp. TaxID=2024823 RepID=UPI000C952158|nr:class I SAM-dependent methyltransferase [Altibacter sp.]MAP54262.1 SAM-dependent methyltransferase [Altibacter sp.]
MNFQKAFDINKETWNKKVAVHAASEFYDVEAFLKGKCSLNEYEVAALGDVSGASLLHLQCHFGQDSLSWARRGAQVTGVDISEKAIEFAQQLNESLSLNANFVCCNVLDTSQFVSEIFDVVFTSYGVIGWLPDLQPWARMIAERLRPGGVFYMIEFHPIAWMFDYTQSPPIMRYGYHQKDVIYEEYQGTYANMEAPILSKEYSWNHALGEVVSALTGAGLRIDSLHEHDASPYAIFPKLQKNKDGMYELENKLYPLVFEVHATKNN